MVNNTIKALLVSLLTLTCTTAVAQSERDNYKPTYDRMVKLTETNLPIVFIDLKGQRLASRWEDRYIAARMKIIHNGEGNLNYGDTIAHPDQRVDYEGWIAIKYRGNSSFNSSDKKPYQFRTLKTEVLPDDGGEKDKVKILGMGKDNKWAVIAPFSDKVMFRDVLTFELARPWMDFVPDCRICEFIIDGTYYGVYVIAERVSKGAKRLNLHDMGADDGDLTGEFHVEIDRGDDPYYASKYHPWSDFNGTEESNRTIKYQYKDPDDEDFATLPEGAKAAIGRQIDDMEATFAREDYTNPKNGYLKKIDDMSFIDHMLSVEVSMNIDGYRLSTNLYKYSETRAKNEGLDPRWKMSLWDFNIAWGNANYYSGQKTNVWHYTFNQRERNDAEHVPFYWYKLLNDTAYVNRMKARWVEYRNNNYSDERIYATIDSLANLITSHGAADRNQQAWGCIGRNIWPNAYVGHSYQDEVDYMKSWTKQRLSFMDKALLPPVPKEIIPTEPVVVASGWNHDVIAEKLPVSSSVSETIDGGNRTFFAASVNNNGGLPDDRVITSEAEGIIYKLSPYDENNCLRISESGKTETIVFESTFRTKGIYMLTTSGGGSSEWRVVVNYSNGTSEPAQTIYIRDWSVREENLDGTEAKHALGNISRNNDAMSSDNHYCLFESLINTDTKKQVKSLTITSINSSIGTVFAFSKIVENISDINNTATNSSTITGIFSPSGMKLQQMQKGLNIVKQADGTTKKIFVK